MMEREALAEIARATGVELTVISRVEHIDVGHRFISQAKHGRQRTFRIAIIGDRALQLLCAREAASHTSESPQKRIASFVASSLQTASFLLDCERLANFAFTLKRAKR